MISNLSNCQILGCAASGAAFFFFFSFVRRLYDGFCLVFIPDPHAFLFICIETYPRRGKMFKGDHLINHISFPVSCFSEKSHCSETVLGVDK